jgi:hypothetical protein
MIFHSKKLDKLHKKKKLKGLLKHLSHQINSDTWIGSGSEAAAFYFDHQIVKVCPKEIRFFRDANHSDATLFQKQVNQLQPFLVPINKILYEDDYVVCYTQHRCQLLKNENYLSPYIVISFLQLIIFMFEKNQLVSDIGLHNLGLLDGQLVVFDYHGLHPIIKDNYIFHHQWWKRPITNLSVFLSHLDNGKYNASDHYQKFLLGLLQCQDKIDLQQLIQLLYKCLNLLTDEQSLQQNEWEMIFERQSKLMMPNSI